MIEQPVNEEINYINDDDILFIAVKQGLKQLGLDLSKLYYDRGDLQADVIRKGVKENIIVKLSTKDR